MTFVRGIGDPHAEIQFWKINDKFYFFPVSQSETKYFWFGS